MYLNEVSSVVVGERGPDGIGVRPVINRSGVQSRQLSSVEDLRKLLIPHKSLCVMVQVDSDQSMENI